MSRRRHGNVINAAVAAPFVAALVALVVASCGNDGDDNAVKRGDASSDSTTGTTDAFLGDGTFETTPGFDAARPDGGPAPVVACGDGGADAGTGDAGECTLPPSVCLVDHGLLNNAGGTSNPASVTCDTRGYELLCAQSTTPPDCYQGGCRVVIVR